MKVLGYKYGLILILLFSTLLGQSQYVHDLSLNLESHKRLIASHVDDNDDIFLFYSDAVDSKIEVYKYNGLFYVQLESFDFVQSIQSVETFDNSLFVLGLLSNEYYLMQWQNGNWRKLQFKRRQGNGFDFIPDMGKTVDGVYLFTSGHTDLGGIYPVTNNHLFYRNATWRSLSQKYPPIVNKVAFTNDTLYIETRDSVGMPINIYMVGKDTNALISKDLKDIHLVNGTENFLFFQSIQGKVFRRGGSTTEEITDSLNKLGITTLIKASEKGGKALFYGGDAGGYSITNEQFKKKLSYTSTLRELELAVTSKGYFVGNYKTIPDQELFGEIKWNHHLLRGVLYFDLNNSKRYEEGEDQIRPNHIFSVNGQVASSDREGNYQISLSAGSNGIIDPNLDTVFNQSTDANQPFTAIEDSVEIRNIGYTSTSSGNDIGIKVNLGRARHGYVAVGSILLENQRNFDAVIDVSLILDYRISNFTSDSLPNPSGSLIQWQNVTIPRLSKKTVSFSYRVNENNLITGDTLVFIGSLTNVLDSFEFNNQDTSRAIVTSAYDPNIKVCFPTDSTTVNVSKIRYTIHFQNTGNDTAINVFIVDTLERRFPIQKVVVTGTSHPGTYNLLSPIQNSLIWEFRGIMLVDSATNEVKSKGWISMDVYLKDTLKIGEVARNRAHIYFDYQDPVATNYAILKRFRPDSVKLSELELEVFPNPFVNELKVKNNGAVDREITIYDVTGKLVSRKTCIGNSKISINVFGYTQGLYFVLSDGEYLGKIVKSE